MPIYEYKCLDCGHQFEQRTKIYNPDPPTCPHVPSFSEEGVEALSPEGLEVLCGGKVRKLISRTSFVLKGGGWYKDGY